jgi:hypothetical protein
VYRAKGATASGAAGTSTTDAAWTKVLAHARELASRLAATLQQTFTDLWQRVVEAARKLSHYLERYAKCIERHVRPFGNEAVARMREMAAAAASAFWNGLGSSLQGLSPADRERAVQAPWNELLTRLRASMAEARGAGTPVVKSWFVQRDHKESAAQEYLKIYDAGLQATEGELAQSYRANVGK